MKYSSSHIVGRSQQALLLLLVLFGLAIFKSEGAQIVNLIVGACVIYLVWFFASMLYAYLNPQGALLEGTQWSSFEKFKASTKSVPALSGSSIPTLNPAIAVTTVPQITGDGKEPEE